MKQKKAKGKKPVKSRSAKTRRASHSPSGDQPATGAPAVAVAETTEDAGLSKLGPLLRRAISGMVTPGATRGLARVAMDSGLEGAAEAPPVLPVSLTAPRLQPEPGEKWIHFKQRAADALGPIREWLQQNAGLKCLPSYSAVSLSSRGLVGQLQEASKHDGIQLIELDHPRQVTLLDDVAGDLEISPFLQRHPNLDGSGIRVAVIDSGIDVRHPWIQVADSVETCGESVDIPGPHGTHVAGCLASRDAVYRGIAPGTTIINIKALTSLGNSTSGQVTRGIDAALDREANILSMSVGFNHLPTWSDNGHGWRCPDGRCDLCTAVNNAVLTDGVFVVVAAGNEHLRAEFLRNNGNAGTFDSEIACPGAAAQALTVGSITKRTFLTADSSSRGPTAYAAPKPDIAAPGVNITSCAPVLRDAAGNPLPNLTRGDLSRRSSGTSMATPIVTGVVALIMQRRKAAGLDLSPKAIRSELLGQGFSPIASPPSEVGVGRLNLAGI